MKVRIAAIAVLFSVLWLLPVTALDQKRFVLLTGWGGGKPEEICPKAADVGFNEIIVWNRDPAYLAHLAEVAAQYHIAVYASVHLSDLKTWKARYPNTPPPLQVMNAEEDAALQRIQSDNRPGKGGYQFGGEPVGGLEVLTAEMLCFHRPEVLAFLKDEATAALAVPGIKGVAFDYFGYRNYRNCQCDRSRQLLAEYRNTHPDLGEATARDRFSLDSLVAFNNELAAFGRNVRPGTKVATHVYPTFLPEPLYGSRLDVDYCCQTVAWFFVPYWSRERTAEYATRVVREQSRFFPNARGVPFIGVYAGQPFADKTPDRLAAELAAVRDAVGLSALSIYNFDEFVKHPELKAVLTQALRAAPQP
jgi:hypothetical protein